MTFKCAEEFVMVAFHSYSALTNIQLAMYKQKLHKDVNACVNSLDRPNSQISYEQSKFKTLYTPEQQNL